MSTHRRQTQTEPEPEFSTPNTSFTARDAPRTFDPFNTNQTPELFENKWQVTEE